MANIEKQGTLGSSVTKQESEEKVNGEAMNGVKSEVSTIATEQVEPVADVDPVLSMSTIVTECVEPIASVEPSLSLSTIATVTEEAIAPTLSRESQSRFGCAAQIQT